MLTALLYFFAATGAIAWALFLWSFARRDVPLAWQAAIFTQRQWKAEKAPLRYWYRVLPVWFNHWVSPCDSMTVSSRSGGYTIYWPGKEPKGKS